MTRSRLPLIAFVLVETLIMLVGVGCVISYLVRGGAPGIPDTGLLLDCALAGLVIGAVLARFTARLFDAPQGMGWVWLYTLLGGWLLGGGLYFLKTSGVVADWTLVGMAATFGTLPGMGAGFLLAATQARFRAPAPPVPAYAPDLEEEDVPIPIMTRPPMQSGAARQSRLRDTLGAELAGLEKEYPGSETRLYQFDPERLAVMFTMPSYLGKVTYYIVCSADYPDAPPDEIHMEVFDPTRNNAIPLPVEYDTPVLDEWDNRTGNASLLLLVKDGFLQIEDDVLHEAS